MRAEIWILGALALAVLAVWMVGRGEWFDLDEANGGQEPTTQPASTLPDRWPERRPLATRHHVRVHAQACAAVDHAAGRSRANPYPQQTDAFVQWAIHYAEARELLSH